MFTIADANTNELEKKRCKLLVVGAGLAGLSAALYASRETGGKIYVLSAAEIKKETNTYYAQGGIAAPLDHADVKVHINDTLRAGDGLNRKKAVAILVKEGLERITDLKSMGLKFDKGLPSKESGHSVARVLHIGGDATGKNMEEFFLKKAAQVGNIELVPNCFLIDILVENEKISGALVMRKNKKEVIYADAIILATGGYAAIFEKSSNPPGTIGNGLAIAYRAGAELMDLEFVQFHPTTVDKGGLQNFLISEAVRGEGAYLINDKNEHFMDKPEFRRRAEDGSLLPGELATRDIVSREIWKQMQNGRSVFIDARHVSTIGKFKTICKNTKIETQLVRISPAAHYTMGGIKTNLRGMTAIKGLYACGECACNGAQGANRLASNSLLEALVFGARAGIFAARERKKPELNTEHHFTITRKVDPPLYKTIRKINWKHAGIIRDADSLAGGMGRIARIGKSLPRDDSITAYKLQNMLTVSLLMYSSALKREESRGAHFRLDYPYKRYSGKEHIIVSTALQGPQLARFPFLAPEK